MEGVIAALESSLGEPARPIAGRGARRASIAAEAPQPPLRKHTPQRRHSLPDTSSLPLHAAAATPLHPAAADAEAAHAAFLQRMRRGREQAQERSAAALYGWAGSPPTSPPPLLHARSPPGRSPAALAAAELAWLPHPHVHTREWRALQAAAAGAAAAAESGQRALAEAREAEGRLAAAAAAVRAQVAEARERAAAAAAEGARQLAAAEEAEAARRQAAEARERAAAAAARRQAGDMAEAARRLTVAWEQEASSRQATAWQWAGAEAMRKLTAAWEAEVLRRREHSPELAAARRRAAAEEAALQAEAQRRQQAEAEAAAQQWAVEEAARRQAAEQLAEEGRRRAAEAQAALARQLAAAAEAARQQAAAEQEEAARRLTAAAEAAARHSTGAVAARLLAAVEGAGGDRWQAAAAAEAAGWQRAAAAAATATAARSPALPPQGTEAARRQAAEVEAVAWQQAAIGQQAAAAAAAAAEREARDRHAREAAEAAAEAAARQKAHAAAEARATELRAAQEAAATAAAAAAAAAAAEKEARDRHAREAAAAAAEAAARQRAHAAAEARAAELRAAQEATTAAAEIEARARRAREAAAAATGRQREAPPATLYGGGGAAAGFAAAVQPARDSRTGTYPLALSGTWTRAECTGYEEVEGAPQWRIVPAASGSLTIDLKGGYKSPSASLALVPAHPRGVKFSGQPDGYGQFCNTESSITTQVSAGTAYTLILTTHGKGLAVGMTELGWKITGNLPLLEPPAPLTLALRTLLDADAQAAKAAEKARRAAALARMQAAPSGTTAKESWDDFQVASARVEVLRAECRARGRPFEDGWSGSSKALGAWKGDKAEWARFVQLAPNPVVFENGYRLQDVEQGALGDCYFLAAVADLAGGLGAHLEGVLDTLFVTAEPNPEGVYCVRLWVAGRWQHFLMDERLPCRPDSYVTIGQPDSVFSSSAAEGPDPSHGRFIPLRSVSSHSRNAMWPCLLEKAWAMLHGSYADIEGHARNDALSPLNYFLPHSLEYTCQPVPLPSGGYSSSSGGNRDTVLSEDELWDKLTLWQAKGWPMTTGSRTTAASGAGGDHGIVRKHAFSLMRVFTTPTNLGGEHLLQLRNPHGKGEWDGRYSDKDTASWTPALRAATGYNPEASGNDGIFFMCLQDFQFQFDSVNVTPNVCLAKDGGGWHKAEVRGTFTSAQLRASAAQGDWLDKALQFPQLLIHSGGASGEVTVMLELDQRSRKKGDQHPEIVLHCYSYRHGTGVTPAKSRDHYPSSDKPSIIQSLKGQKCSNGCTAATRQYLPGSSLVFIPEAEDLEGRESASYTLSVLSETAFTCRVAQPGASSSTEEGVEWVSRREVQWMLSASMAEARHAASPTLSPRSEAIAMGMDERTLARIYGISRSHGEQALGGEPVQPGMRRASIAWGALQQPAPKPTPQRRHSLPEALMSPLLPAAAGAEAASAAFLERMQRGREQAAALHGKGSPPPRLHHARVPPAAAADWLHPRRAPPGHSPAAAAAYLRPHTHAEALRASAAVSAAPHGGQRALAEAREAEARLAAAAVRAQEAEAREREAAVAARRQAAAAAESARMLTAAAEADEARLLVAEARERAAAAAARRLTAAAAEAARKLAAAEDTEAARRQAAEARGLAAAAASKRQAAAVEAPHRKAAAGEAHRQAAAREALRLIAAGEAHRLAVAAAAEREARYRHAQEAAAVAAAAESALQQRAHAAAGVRAAKAEQEAAAASAAEREARDRHAWEAAAVKAAETAARQRAHAAAEVRAAHEATAAAFAESEARAMRAWGAAAGRQHEATPATLHGEGGAAAGLAAAAVPARDARTGAYPLALSGTWDRAECTGHDTRPELPLLNKQCSDSN